MNLRPYAILDFYFLVVINTLITLFMQQSEFFCIRIFPVTFLFFCKDMLTFVKFDVLKRRIFIKILLRNIVVVAIKVTCKTDLM